MIFAEKINDTVEHQRGFRGLLCNMPNLPQRQTGSAKGVDFLAIRCYDYN